MRNISYSYRDSALWPRLLMVVFCVGCLLVGGLTAVRLLYELLFPKALWLGNPAAAVLIAGSAAVLAAGLGQRVISLKGGGALTPLLMNLVYLFKPRFEPTAGWFVFVASLWLAALFAAHFRGTLKRLWWLPFVFVVSFLLPVYLATMGQTVGTADTFEFQVVVPKLGIVHPTGYPLYLLLTKLFTFIPINSVAWRANFGTAVYGIAAACLLFQFLHSLTGQRLAPILAAVLFGLTPTFWSQAVQAEVYSLHALMVSAVLLAVQRMQGWWMEGAERPPENSPPRKIWGANWPELRVALLLGLGLTNHLTTLVLFPAVLAVKIVGPGVGMEGNRPFHMVGRRLKHLAAQWREGLAYVAALLLPLTLYLYLPLRWQAVNGEPMGLNRFVDWVVGGRFQGALRLTGWLADSARLGVVGRLITAEWGQTQFGLLIGLIGLIILVRKSWPGAMFLGLVLLGFVFYALSYYVPDLSVFLIPAHLIIAALWGVGVAAGVGFLLNKKPIGPIVVYPLLSLLMFFVFQEAVGDWQMVDASQRDGETRWGRAVLAQPLDPEGAILADSLKFPPLYYLQQAEGLRPEMDIMVLPDEAAYRAELDGRLAAGQTVYLARFLPGLAGVYYLNSVGPITAVSSKPQTILPDTADIVPSDLSFESIELLGYQLEMDSPYEMGETAVTFYWQSAEPVEAVWQVYVRWFGEAYNGPLTNQYPANNNYPTNAWRAGEVVADFHSLPRPILNQPGELALQVALAPPFTPPDELGWQTVTTAVWEPQTELVNGSVNTVDLRMQIGPLFLDGASFPEQIRPGSDLLVQLHGFGSSPDGLSLALVPIGNDVSRASDLNLGDGQLEAPFIWSSNVSTEVDPGSYWLVAGYEGRSAVCSWLARETSGCVLGQVEVSGAPLPEGAINFEDEIALLDIEVTDNTFQSGGQLGVRLTWQGLSSMAEDYTVFVQVLNEQNLIVKQIDSWPLQGTFPTSQWQPGEKVEDPYTLQLPVDLPPGQYRLQVGWYLLETLRRLPVLDESGTAVDDKVVVPLVGEE